MINYWSLDSLVAFESLSQCAHSGELSDDEHRTQFGTFGWLDNDD